MAKKRKKKKSIKQKRQIKGRKPLTPATNTAINEWVSQAIRFYQQQDVLQAEQLLLRILEKNPDHPDALHLLGVIRHQQGGIDEAIRLVRKAIDQVPDNPMYLANLGIVLNAAGKSKDAVAAYEKALTIQPDYPEAWNNLGIALKHLGKLDDAVAAYQKAIDIRGNYPEACNNLGNTFMDMGRYSDAETWYRSALAMAPDYADAWFNYGNMLRHQGKIQEAIEKYERAMALKPTASEANNLGNVLKDNLDLKAAKTWYGKAIAMKPDFAQAYYNLGLVLRDQGQVASAIAQFEKALTLKPDYAVAHSNILFSYQYLDGPSCDPDHLYQLARNWNHTHARCLAENWLPFENDPDPHRKLRVGYVSPDFRSHSCAYFVGPLFQYHDRRRVEIFCYSDVARPDQVTQGLMTLVDHWRDTCAMDDDTMAKQIRQDRIDILVDLAGHTAGNRLLVFARKPAPIQISWLGYNNTTGMDAMDYRLTDAWMTPPDTRERFSETVYRLNRCSHAYRPPDDGPDIQPPPALANGYVTFGSFNNVTKIHPDTAALWARVIRSVPGSRLLIKAIQTQDDETRQWLVEMFQKNGVSEDRIRFRPFIPGVIDHLSEYHQVDICLDTYPYNGVTTTCEALWMGIPVITKVGMRSISRVGLSLLTAAGLESLAASDDEAFVRIALDLAGDIEKLGRMRLNMRDRLRQSQLCDVAGFAGQVEDFYFQIWQTWCRQHGSGADLRPTTPGATPSQSVANLWRQALADYQSGRLQEAEQQCRHILSQDPEHADAMHLTGVIRHLSGDHAKAETWIRKAIAQNPNEASYHGNLGVVLRELGNPRQAMKCHETALKLNPNHGDAWNNMGIIHKDHGRLHEAESCYRKALAANPGNVQAMNNLANTLSDQGRAGEAIEWFRKALKARPDYLEVYNNLGNALKNIGQYDEAVACFRKALELRPNYPDAWNNLGVALCDQGDPQAAIEAYQKALNHRPTYAQAHSNLLFALQYLNHPLPEVYQQHRQWHRIHAAGLTQTAAVHDNTPDPDRTLRVGYVSPDFYAHSCAYFFFPLLEHHDPDQVEVFCYADVLYADAVTQRIRDKAANWINIKGMRDEQVAELIRSHRIDILVDLAGHTAHNRLLVFARKPAPIQITWLGYNGTTGMDAMDYRISDAILTPSGCTEQFSEKLVVLPRCSHVYSPPMDAPDVGPLPARSRGYIRFGSFNNLTKVSPETLDMWADVLRQVPDAKLMIKAKQTREQAVKERFIERLVQRGVSRDRVDILPYQLQVTDHLAAYHHVDICLDTFPYNGVTTTCEALWMGVPVVTRTGDRSLARVATSLLTSAGLEAYCAESRQGFVSIAVELARDTTRLEALRTTMRQRLEQSPLMDGADFARHLETAYRDMWHAWCHQTDHGRSYSHTHISERPDKFVFDIRDPDHLYQQAVSLHQQGKISEADAMYRNVLEMQPNHARALNGLGIIAGQAGEAQMAMDLMRRAIEIQPDLADAHFHLGVLLEQQGDAGQAMACFETVLAIQPDHTEAWVRLGKLAYQNGQFETAARAWQTALDGAPDQIGLKNNLGLALYQLGKDLQAINCWQEVLAVDPDNVNAYNNMGNCHHTSGDLESAIQCFQKAHQLRPDLAGICYNLGNVYKDRGDLDQAGLWYQKALEIKPDYAQAHSNWLFSLLYSDTLGSQEIFKAHQKWQQIHAAAWTPEKQGYPNEKSIHRRLKIGYVSPDFRKHSCAHFFLPLLQAHDRQQVEIFCYAEIRKPDTVTAQIQALSDHWRVITGKPDDAVASEIQQDGIDILMDLAGHTGENRLLVFARKPAPIQVTWLGYPATTGLTTMDYRLSDACLTPEDTAESFSETLYLLPRSSHAYFPPLESPDVTNLPMITSGNVTFGSFNNLTKITPTTVSLWASALKAVSHSRLLLKSKHATDPWIQQRILKLMADHGIDRNRITFAPYADSLFRHLAMYGDMDIALDTFPYNGVTTTCETLWMGVPVVSFFGDDTRSRLGLSLLSAAGMEHLATDDPDRYVEIIRNLLYDPDDLQLQRMTMRERLICSPLLDIRDFARHLEGAFRDMWQRWCNRASENGC